jgi:hypothetical protein
MTVLAHHLDRTITIGAPPATVFRYFTDSARWAAWWGVGSTIDPRPGGRVYIRYPNAVEVAVEVPAIQMRDRFSSVEGVDELSRHIGAAQRFMPGMRLQREGPAQHCQGTIVADWTAVGPDGQPRGRGTNVFILSAEGRIESVTGLWKV